jgi:hypothetical protein
VARTAGTKTKRWAALRRGLSLAAAVVVAWMAFFAAGKLLLKIPAEVHEGTIWNSLSGNEP